MTVRSGTTWTFKLPNVIFRHPDGLDFDIEVVDAPYWAPYDSKTETFSGKATEDEVGVYQVFLVATDTLGA